VTMTAINDGSNISVVSRSQDILELWWTTPTSAIGHAYWYDRQLWEVNELVASSVASKGSAVASTSRLQGIMDMWYQTSSSQIGGQTWDDDA
jgi:hypothetical protein